MKSTAKRKPDGKKRKPFSKTSLTVLVGRFCCGLCCVVPSQWHWCWVAALMRTLISPTHRHRDTQSRAAITLTPSDTNVEHHTHMQGSHTLPQTSTTKVKVSQANTELAIFFPDQVLTWTQTVGDGTAVISQPHPPQHTLPPPPLPLPCCHTLNYGQFLICTYV